MNKRAKIVITDFLTEQPDCEREILGDLADIACLDASSEDELAGRIEDADAVMLYHVIKIGERTINALKNCKLIVRCGVGYDNVDRAAARRRGIPVANVPDYGTEDVADSAIGMALTLGRGIHFLNSRLRRGHGPWTYMQAQPISRLRGRTFGIIGIGRIGTASALRANKTNTVCVASSASCVSLKCRNAVPYTIPACRRTSSSKAASEWLVRYSKTKSQSFISTVVLNIYQIATKKGQG